MGKKDRNSLELKHWELIKYRISTLSFHPDIFMLHFTLDFADKTIIRNLIMEYHQRENVSSVVPWFITERNQIFVIHGLLFPKELHSID